MDFLGLTRFLAYKQVKETLHTRGIAEADREARLLIAEAIKGDISSVFLYPDQLLADDSAQWIDTVIQQRLIGMPLQYAMKTAYFMGLSFYVDKNVLIPRPETEILVEKALRFIGPGHNKVLDLCTGSGCIAVSIANEDKNAEVTASDRYPEVLAIAQKNAVKNGVEGRIRFLKSDMFHEIDGLFDCIVSNPPYISQPEYDKLEANVREYEPKTALAAGEDGLFYYHIIAKESSRYLEKNGRLFLEIGCNQAESVADLLGKNGFCNVECIKDYSNLDRIITAKVKE